MDYRLFLSAVSDDYRADRVWLAQQFRQPNFHVIEQSDFGEYGVNTLVKLSDYIAHPGVVVIHLIGPKVGSVPPVDHVAAFLKHLGGEAAVRAKLPTLFEDDAYRRLTYTQWEAWLALFHGRQLLVCEDTAPTAAAAPGALPVAEHLVRLRPERGYAIGFTDRIELRDGVQKALLRLLKDGSFHEDRPRNLPLATLGELFIGRDAFLKKLADSFRAARAAQAFPNHLIHGVGGVGKTRAAVEYGLRSEHLYTALLFVNGETASDLERTLADLAGVLRLNLPAAATNPERVAAVAEWLKAHPGWLLVVDNVDDEAARNAVNGWLAQWHGGHVVITGRYIHWGRDVVPLELDVLLPDDARDFLLRATETRRKPTPDDAAVARSIAVDDLGQLCLALEQASAYVCHEEIELAEYQALWRANEEDVRGWADKLLMKYHEEKEVSLSVATTWQTSVNQLSADARRLLEMLSWLAHDPIPQTIFDAIEKTDMLPKTKPLLVELRSFSLLQRADDAGFKNPGKVHRLVQLITREQLPAPKPTLTAMLTALWEATPTNPSDVRTWPVWNPLQPHTAIAVQHGDIAGITDPTAQLMNQFGRLLKAKALYADAEPLMRRSLAIDERAYGPDHPAVAIRLNNLAQLLKATGRLADAEPLMRRSLTIDERAYGPDHPDVAIDLNNLASLLQATGRLADAEPLLRRAVGIFHRVSESIGRPVPNLMIALDNYRIFLEEQNVPADEVARRLALFQLPAS